MGISCSGITLTSILTQQKQTRLGTEILSYLPYSSFFPLLIITFLDANLLQLQSPLVENVENFQKFLKSYILNFHCNFIKSSIVDKGVLNLTDFILTTKIVFEPSYHTALDSPFTLISKHPCSWMTNRRISNHVNLDPRTCDYSSTSALGLVLSLLELCDNLLF